MYQRLCMNRSDRAEGDRPVRISGTLLPVYSKYLYRNCHAQYECGVLAVAYSSTRADVCTAYACSQARKAITAFWPPKPKALARATRTGRRRATCGT